ncbi:MAG: peptide-methionine (S)-S-oxide reductase MsrA [Rickettsiaceae bacterium]|nr:peptide-methionine (S)-S-oxide reductase MsrA [Rickettsiaceae bacterium]MDP5020154.1 peptide-methionine (S)-S-oxide reductase MsrA [Rickettsiaceae bacterium]MDP5082748.1 peptide-methionine (S)-S-oxide reductase MsrA [Rickettsiaceae bacterium]
MRNAFKILLLILITYNINVMAAEKSKYNNAIFAMGCFWCADAAFLDHETNKNIPGIIAIRTGYTGGDMLDPTYKNHEGHKEAIKITYDPNIISYEKLLDIFWHNIDPFDDKGQFCDKGFAYTSAIYQQNDEQRLLAEKTKQEYEKTLGQKIVTEILAAKIFYEAEEHHQDYKTKNPARYKYYYWRCGRSGRLSEVWGN